MSLEIGGLSIDKETLLLKTMANYDMQQANFIDTGENFYLQPDGETAISFRMASMKTASAYRNVIRELLSRDTSGALDAVTNLTIMSQRERHVKLGSISAADCTTDF